MQVSRWIRGGKEGRGGNVIVGFSLLEDYLMIAGFIMKGFIRSENYAVGSRQN